MKLFHDIARDYSHMREYAEREKAYLVRLRRKFSIKNLGERLEIFFLKLVFLGFLAILRIGGWIGRILDEFEDAPPDSFER